MQTPSICKPLPIVDVAIWLERGRASLAAGKAGDAVAALHEASLLAPEDGIIHALLAEAFRANGQNAEAIEAELASIALDQRNALMFYNLGTFYFKTQRPAAAVKWYRLALEIDPALVAAHQNLASILEMTGNRGEARHHRDEAYRRQCLFIDDAPAPVRTVLILCTAGTGNVPLDFLLPQTCNRRIKWMMEYASLEQVAQLPPYDLVFNAIGDPDVTQNSRHTVQRFLEICGKPVINLPDAVAQTSRDLIPDLIKDLDHVVMPPTVRLRADAKRSMDAARLTHAGIKPPLLLRPVGSHGGLGMQLLETSAALATADTGDAEELYVSAYYDYRSADGYYRKYRVVFIDRQPFPYHLAISEHWLVHYASANMLPYQWKREEEMRFLAQPDLVLGEGVTNVLCAIGQRIDLDYFGIDFSIMPDGRMLVFEANATMLVHTEHFHEALKFKNPYVLRIIEAFDALLKCRASNGKAIQIP